MFSTIIWIRVQIVAPVYGKCDIVIWLRTLSANFKECSDHQYYPC